MNETKFRSLVCDMLEPIAAFRVENMIVGSDEVGTPDVCTTHGWIELKIATSPARESTRLSVRTRSAQRLWHRNWRARGGRSWVLTLLDQSDWMLHDGAWACEHLGMVTKLETIAGAHGNYWPGGPSGRALLSAVMGAMTG